MQIPKEQIDYKQEEWIRWEPVIGLQGKYDVEKLMTDINGLIVILYSCNNKNHKVELTFKPCADSYREVNESFRIKLFHELAQKHGNGFYAQWTFFKVMNSEYLAWLAIESYDWSKENNFTHFSLICDDTVVDVISRNEPLVKVYSV